MAYNKTVFSQMLQLISRLEFQSLVNRHQGDFRVRHLSCWSQFIHLLFVQLSDTQSLRDAVCKTQSMSHKLYHLGCQPTARSTLAEANANRSHLIYSDLFFSLLKRVETLAPKHKLKLNRKLYLIDSTTIDLCLKLFPWARFRKTKAAVKIHTLLAADGALPEFINITDGKVHDVTALGKLRIPPRSFVAIDRAYHCFKAYKAMQDNNIRFVTRMKSNARFEILSTREGDQSSGIIADQIIAFTGYKSQKDYPHPLRRIQYWDQERQKEILFLTNEMSLDAKTIADIYKARWEIEIFFKTIKQNLKIKRFIGNNPNAVMTQIFVAMIAYLMMSYHKFKSTTSYSLQQLFRIIGLNLFEGRCLLELIYPEKKKPPNPGNLYQLSFFKT